MVKAPDLPVNLIFNDLGVAAQRVGFSIQIIPEAPPGFPLQFLARTSLRDFRFNP